MHRLVFNSKMTFHRHPERVNEIPVRFIVNYFAAFFILILITNNKHRYNNGNDYHFTECFFSRKSSPQHKTLQGIFKITNCNQIKLAK